MPRESIKAKAKRSKEIYHRLATEYPNIGTFLEHDSPFQLLIAVILSAQCTDERVNKVTPTLFTHFPDCKTFANAPIEILKEDLKSINFFNNKAKNCLKTAQILLEDYKGEVPPSLDALVKLPGVGRKTANVVLGQAFDIPGITVDTHVKRLSQRLGFTKEDDPVKAEKDLMKLWPEEDWNNYSSILIVHGRQVCDARKPNCEHCLLEDSCPKVGIKAKA